MLRYLAKTKIADYLPMAKPEAVNYSEKRRDLVSLSSETVSRAVFIEVSSAVSLEDKVSETGMCETGGQGARLC